MQLIINDEVVDVEFTNERTLFDVYQSVEAEALSHSRYVVDFKVDDHEVSRSFLEKTEIDAVKTFEFWIGDSQAVLLNTARTIDQYLDQVGSTLYHESDLSQDDLTDLKQGFDWVKQFMESAAEMLQFSLTDATVVLPDGTTSNALSEVIQSTVDEITVFNDDNRELLLQNFRAIKAFTGRLIVRLYADSLTGTDIQKGLSDFETELPALIEKFIKVNESYQSGKDGAGVEILDQAMSELNDFLPFLFAGIERLTEEQRQIQIELSSTEPIDTTIEGISLSLVQLLTDLSTALEENDIVAAGDILEYELADQLQHLKPLFQELKKLLPNDAT